MLSGVTPLVEMLKMLSGITPLKRTNIVWYYPLSSYMFELKSDFASSKYSGHKHLSETIMMTWQCFSKETVLDNVVKFTGKRLC